MGCSGSSTRCTRRRRWASSCGSSPTATPASSPRSPGRIWSGLAERTDLLPGIEEQAYVDIDSLLRPVYGHAKQGASFGHTKIAGKQVLRKGLSPLATTISTPTAAPVVAGIRLRAGKAGSGRGADSMVIEAIRTARGCRGDREDLGPWRLGLRHRAVVNACLGEGVEFSFVLAKNPAVTAAIASIAENAWTPVDYPGAVLDPDTGELISDAEVAEVTFTAFATTEHPVTARLIVRRVRDQAKLEELFPVWRHHPFFTNNTEPVTVRRYDPPPARDHRDRLRRPHRRTSGPSTLRSVRRQPRVGASARRWPTTCSAPPAPCR